MVRHGPCDHPGPQFVDCAFQSYPSVVFELQHRSLFLPEQGCKAVFPRIGGVARSPHDLDKFVQQGLALEGEQLEHLIGHSVWPRGFAMRQGLEAG